MKPDSERLTELEIIVAEQEKTICELSGELAGQWKTLEALHKSVGRLTERLLSLEERAAAEVPVTRRPHW